MEVSQTENVAYMAALIDPGGKLNYEYKKDVLDAHCPVVSSFSDIPLTANFVFYYVHHEKDVDFLTSIIMGVGKAFTGKVVIVANPQYNTDHISELLTLPIHGLIYTNTFKTHFEDLTTFFASYTFLLDPELHKVVAEAIFTIKHRSKPIKKFVLNDKQVEGILKENEKIVLEKLINGKSTGEIAKEMYFAPSTINNVIGRLLMILNANDRTEAVVKAIRSNWVSSIK
ncbi:helix-turn-helix transcriptional regulator [Salipaludibacillus sp. LMS25]|jgi:two-component system response regulator DegU|uniref:response regulator transcription factor n=1 Tax=Salipaludibacillus sp. LMS25 TaxID=2924031 RepID=UPI0020CFF400|nr:helix-turn-helix transcriptional regulator [Salipaludibacillus sp. LMS25]UTR16159.1 helix-turn-helix transcriptional regulator [Salipaludibacillus sp. LMS25]